MKQTWFARPLELATGAFYSDGKPNYRFVLGLATFGIVQMLAVFLACWHENTLVLPSPGRGLLQHYGAGAILVSDAIFLIAAGFALGRFRLAMRDAPLAANADARRRWDIIVERGSGWIEARGASAYAYALCVVLGIACWLVNVRNTIHPEYPDHYSHDVFDGWSHPIGFVIFKICLFTSWVVVFPIVGYLLLMMSYATWAILHSAQRSGLLAARVTHPDGCYGFAKFGELNISILAPFLLAYAVMLSLWVTHAKPYETLLLPMAGMTLAFLLASYFALYPLYIVIRDARDKIFRKLKEQAIDIEDKDRMEFAIERLCFESAKSTPYDSGMRLFLLGMRGVTIGTTTITFFVQYRGLIGM